MLKNDIFLRALLKQPVEYTPVWIMRQAGRYLPEYRAIRQKAGSFMSLCKNKTLACEVALQPLQRFNLDAAILFSDILTIPDAMGLGLHFETGEGPIFRYPVRDIKAVRSLEIPDSEDALSYVTDAVSLIKKTLNGSVPLIGFSGSPWTLATYMVEGKSTKEFKLIKGLMYNEPETVHLLLEKLAAAVTDYLNAQIRHGADVVQIFDTWGGILTPEAYREFSLQYMERIIKGLIRQREGREIPVILFTKNSGLWLEAIVKAGATTVGLDWTINMADARRRIGDKVSLQGNMDPCLLYASPTRIRQEVKKILHDFSDG
ncbi:MAG: uroporphyrinogen decarboxylase, partial [Endozoicomonadaceae bacterium]|nr:uroporphyrinogen decarboxylase [Endozoicomonadaceae bacterium]